MQISDFELGHVYNRNQLMEAFGGSFMGGMNICNRTNTLVLISKHTKRRVYGDGFDGDLLIYTGEGQRGDQSLSRAGNRKLYNSNRDRTPVHLFVVYKPTQYTYFGLVKLFGEPYTEIEQDVDGNDRLVYRFPLMRLVNGVIPLTLEECGSIQVGGTIPSIMPTYNVVGAAIFDENKVLCAQRGYGDLKGKWEFPGGKIESGESPIEALKREIKEELNLDVEVCDKVDESSFDYPKFKVNLSVFSCKIIGGSLKDEEHQDLKWVKANEIESLDWADADKPIVDSIVDSLPMEISENVKFDYFEYAGVKSTDRELMRANQDYEAANRKKKVAGEKAEAAVIRYEKGKLNNIGRPDLANLVSQVSKKSSDYGYDVLSFDIVDGQAVESHIEVKSATYSGGFIEFFISANELNKFKTDKSHKIYALIKSGHSYKLHVVNKNDFFAHDFLTPITYRVRIRVVE